MQKLIKILKTPRGAVIIAAAIATAVAWIDANDIFHFLGTYCAGASACLAAFIIIDEE